LKNVGNVQEFGIPPINLGDLDVIFRRSSRDAIWQLLAVIHCYRDGVIFDWREALETCRFPVFLVIKNDEIYIQMLSSYKDADEIRIQKKGCYWQE